MFSTTWHTPLRAAFGGWDEKKLSVSKVVTNALNNGSGNGYNNNNNNYSAADAGEGQFDRFNNYFGTTTTIFEE